MQPNYQIQQIKITDITPNRFQPRIKFEESSLQELANSIKKYGIIEPLILRKLKTGYEIIAGERRLLAASRIGLTTVPAIVMEIDDKTSAELAIIENLQRQNLTPIEEAKAYQNLTNEKNIKEVSQLVSKEENIINNKIKLLKLSPKVQEALQNSEISEGHAKALLQIENHEQEEEMLNRIKKERLTVKQVLDIIKENKNETDIEEMDVNPNMQQVLSGLDIVLKKSNTFNDTESGIVEDKMDKTQMIDINAIKEAAQDINQPKITTDINNLLKVDDSIQLQEQPQEKPKFSFAGKYFSSLEDESTNMNLDNNFVNSAKNVEIIPDNNKVEPPQSINIENIDMPITNQNIENNNQHNDSISTPLPNFNEPITVENKIPTPQPTDINTNNFTNQENMINTWDISNVPNIKPISEVQEISQIKNDNNNITEPISTNQNTFVMPEPIQQPYNNSFNIEQEENNNQIKEQPFLPEFNIEQEEENNNQIKEQPVNPYYLKNALNMSRELINNLEASGYIIDTEELDLINEYQITIKIKKNN